MFFTMNLFIISVQIFKSKNEFHFLFTFLYLISISVLSMHISWVSVLSIAVDEGDRLEEATVGWIQRPSPF